MSAKSKRAYEWVEITEECVCHRCGGTGVVKNTVNDVRDPKDAWRYGFIGFRQYLKDKYRYRWIDVDNRVLKRLVRAKGMVTYHEFKSYKKGLGTMLDRHGKYCNSGCFWDGENVVSLSSFLSYEELEKKVSHETLVLKVLANIIRRKGELGW